MVAEGVIVIGADRVKGASIHAFAAASGRELWKQAAGPGVNGPIVGSSGRAFAGTLEGRLVSLDVRSGTTHWNLPLKVVGWEGPAVAGDHVFAGTSDGWLHSLNAETGRERWRLNLAAPVTTSVTAGGTDVYVGTADGSVHRVDAERGTVVRSHKLDPVLMARSAIVRTPTSLLILLTDKGAEYRALVAVDLALERVRWRVAAPTVWSTSRAFVFGDVVVVATASGNVAAYCHATGAAAWSRAVKGPVRSIGGDGDLLLVGTRSGDLYAMRAPRSCNVK